jgi:hypothetical protein
MFHPLAEAKIPTKPELQNQESDDIGRVCNFCHGGLRALEGAPCLWRLAVSRRKHREHERTP